jgi:hypothetical protein
VYAGFKDLLAAQVHSLRKLLRKAINTATAVKEERHPSGDHVIDAATCNGIGFETPG